MSASSEKALELKVGIFVFIGLVFIAFMAFKFGRIGQGFQKYYDLTIDFPNASGLIKNSDVQLAGARIGYVADKPRIAAATAGVTVPVKIIEGIRIPRQTTFQVGSSGLLGDKFVDVIPDSNFDPAKFNPEDPAQVRARGEKVEGTKAGGLEALQQKGEEVFDQLKIELRQLTEVTEKINSDVLSDQNRKNIGETFANLKTTTERVAETSKNLNTVVQNAQGVVDSTKETMGTVNAAAGDLRKVLEVAKTMLNKAQNGNGVIAALLTNRQFSENLQVLVANLRERGILFYKDRATRPTPPDRKARP